MNSRISVLVGMIAAILCGLGCGGGSIGTKITPNYTISVSVTGLTGTLVLQNNGANNLSVSANGSDSFTTQIASGSAYAVTILTQPTGQTCSLGSNAVGTASSNVMVSVTCSTTTYTISVSVTGLTGTGLVFQDNGGDNLSVSANGTFPFATQIASGGAYAITILTQPSGQTCTIISGSGTATANVTVAVTCSVALYTISVSVSGLTGTGLVLQDNGTNNLSVTGNGTFPFTTQIASGAAYAVTILTQPSGQTCSLGSNASGTATANVTVSVTCAATMYTISVSVSGLTGTGLQFQDNGGDNLSVNANGTFPFATKIASGGTYAVTILTQPSGQTCALGSGASGTATANVTVAVTCTATLYTISAAVSGLTGTGLVLQDNGADNLSVTTNGTFPFATQIASGGTYAVAILTQPTGQTCTLGTNATGTATANVTVTVTCAATTYTIGGTVSGLTATMILQDTGSNGTQTVTILSGATTFTFPTAVPSGSSYSVIVSSQPTGENCTVANGGGTADANVTNIAVTCVTAYTIGGSITGLTGTMTLLDTSTGGNQTVTANSGASSFTFPTAVPTGTGYNVTVQTQPSGQTCTVAAGTGTVGNANVTNISVSCTATVTYSIGGSVSGLTGTMTLLDTGSNGNQNVTVPSGATSFTFPNNVPSGSTYNVTVSTQPTGETCTVAAGQGTATGNVTTIAVTCGTGNTFTLGGTIYDLSANPSSTGVVLEYNNANSETFVTNGTFAFSTPIAAGTAYTVKVQTQPSSPAQNCTINNASGTANADVTNVQVVCIGEWTWINGADVVAQNGNYGTKGKQSGGDPGARYEVNSWLDASGNMWMFGGEGYDVENSGPESQLPDLWEFTPGTGWEWVSGANTTRDQCSIYPANNQIGGVGTPGARALASNWIDSSGNLWMFGGYVEDNPSGDCETADPFNDVWEFQASTKTWIWQGPANSIAQNQTGVYPAKGGTGTPGARYGSAGAVDSSGNFWVFGGYGIDGSGNAGYLNDIWEYNSSLNTWTYWDGSTTADAKETGSTPGARVGASAWIDSSGNFWLFGGIVDDSSGNTGDLNDLWEFSLSTHTWTLVAGSETVSGATATYGTQGIPDSANLPGPRVWSTIFQTPNGDVWLFGGTYSSRGEYYNDLWKYSGGQWTWMDGSQGPTETYIGIYNTPPLAPGGRFAGGSWADSSGNLWMFGGYGLASVPNAFDSMNDLWEFQP